MLETIELQDERLASKRNEEKSDLCGFQKPCYSFAY